MIDTSFAQLLTRSYRTGTACRLFRSKVQQLSFAGRILIIRNGSASARFDQAESPGLRILINNNYLGKILPQKWLLFLQIMLWAAIPAQSPAKDLLLSRGNHLAYVNKLHLST
jgi:hypothetical protein